MSSNLIQHIQNFIDVSERDIAIIQKYIVTRSFKKKEFLLQENKICSELFFVEKGCLRMYFINEKAVEQIVEFAIDGWWISDYQSLFRKTASNYYIQTIEESEIVSISNEKLDELLLEVPQLEKYFRQIMQKALAGSQQKSKLLYEMSKEEFYLHFSSSFPEFMQRVPQYMIASYLGLTPEYMSELRKKNL